MGLILLRFGELALKGRNRREFLKRLMHNIRACLRDADLEGQVSFEAQRLYVTTDQVEEALTPLSRVFGLVSLSPVVEVARDLDAILGECVQQARLAGLNPEVSFRVRARRSDKSFPYTSLEISRLGGEAVLRAMEARVDLSDRADLTIGVEVSHRTAMLYGRVIPAPGGLPVGVEGRVVALISGGIDSPVAAWLMMKRGCAVIPVHFSQNAVETQKALDNVAVLTRYSCGWDLRPIVLDHGEAVGPVLERLRAMGQERWSCLFCKRALIARACELADQFGAHAVVMGDSLGQVASQTLANLELVSYGIPKPILRPLVGMDKGEITTLARRIGTFEVSTRDSRPCRFLPQNPVTRGSMARFREILARLEEMAEDGP